MDTLSFGSEAGILSPLQAVADCLESEAWRCLLRQTLAQGLSFPVARQRAATALLGENAQCLRHPNNNLGIEYLRALRSLGSPLVPHTIPRLGAGHDQGQTGLSHVSASYLRERLLEEPGETSLAPHLSPQGVLARLRGMEAEDFSQLPDSGEGLSHRLYDAVQSADSLPALYQLVKTKRYPLARIRRLVLWAFLGLTAQDRLDAPPYLRVLGFTAKGQN